MILSWRVPWSWTYQEARMAGNAVSAINKAFRLHGEKTMRQHLLENLDRHFVWGAHQRYGYLPRAQVYNIRKKRAVGHTIHLRYTDALMNHMAHQKNAARIRGFATQKKYHVHAYLGLPHPMRQPFAREVTYWSPDEINTFGERLLTAVRAELGLQVHTYSPRRAS